MCAEVQLKDLFDGWESSRKLVEIGWLGCLRNIKELWDSRGTQDHPAKGVGLSGVSASAGKRQSDAHAASL